MFQKGKAKRPLIAHSPLTSINIEILERERKKKKGREKRNGEKREAEVTRAAVGDFRDSSEALLGAFFFNVGW